MDGEIPEDVMSQLKRVYQAVKAAAGDEKVYILRETDLHNMILDERDRCASLCRDGDYDSEMRAYGNAFAEIIEGRP